MDQNDLDKLIADSGPAKVEPSAATREGAHAVREMYEAMRLEGFTENQALHVLGVMLGTSGATSNGDS